jgi:hypothetical protein
MTNGATNEAPTPDLCFGRGAASSPVAPVTLALAVIDLMAGSLAASSTAEAASGDVIFAIEGAAVTTRGAKYTGVGFTGAAVTNLAPRFVGAAVTIRAAGVVGYVEGNGVGFRVGYAVGNIVGLRNTS